MIDLILDRLSPTMIGMMFVAGEFFLLAAIMLRPAVCFALGFPALLFLGQLRGIVPISVSAGAAIFPLSAFAGRVLRYHRFIIGRPERLVLLLMLLMIYSLSYSASPAYGREKTLLFCVMVVPVIVFAPMVITTQRSLKTVISVIFAALVIYVLISAVLPARVEQGGVRGAALHDVIVAGQLLGLAAVLMIVSMSWGRVTIPVKFFYAALVPVSFVLLFRTGTRAAGLSVVITLLFICWFARPVWSRRMVKTPLQVYLVVIVAILLLLTTPIVLPRFVTEKNLERFTNPKVLFNNFAGEKIRNWTTSSTRTLYFGCALESFLQHPYRGLGVGGYKHALAGYVPGLFSGGKEKEGALAYPHNMILEFAVEQGVLGLVLVCIILLLNFRMIRMLREMFSGNPSYRLPIASCVGIYVFGFCVSMTSLDVPRMMILWWGMGLLLTADRIYGNNCWSSPIMDCPVKSVVGSDDRGDRA